MIPRIPDIISGLSLLAALLDILSRHIGAWKLLQEQQQELIKALKAETRRNIDIIKELEKEDLKGPALQDPAIRNLISRLDCTKTAEVSKQLDKVLGRRLIKMTKAPSRNNPARVFYAIKITALKIADLQDRAARAAKPAAHATRTILTRRIPLLERKLDIIAAALSPVPATAGTAPAVRKAKPRLPHPTLKPVPHAGKGGA
jgi:hypothetical protein